MTETLRQNIEIKYPGNIVNTRPDSVCINLIPSTVRTISDKSKGNTIENLINIEE